MSKPMDDEGWAEVYALFGLVHEKRLREDRAATPWGQAVARLEPYGVSEHDVVRVLEGWDLALLGDQERAVARALAAKYREALRLAEDLGKIEDNLSRAPGGTDRAFLTQRVATLDAIAGPGPRLRPMREFRRWIGPLTVRVYDLLASKVPPERRQARGQRQPVFNMRALELTVELLNTYPGFQGRFALRFNATDLVSRLQKKGRKAKP